MAQPNAAGNGRRAAARANSEAAGRKGPSSEGGVLEQRWWMRFEELEEYKEAHGDCNVPKGWIENPKLGNWVHKQRERYKEGKMDPEREYWLTTLGFTWGEHREVNISWEEMFRNLEAYKEAHGDCNVPRYWIENPKLATWVNTQRSLHREDKMVPEREYWLTTLGFTWAEPREVSWEDMFKNLKAYKEAHGDCNVPQVCEVEGVNLGTWVHRQRERYKRGKMDPERERQLRELGLKRKPLDEEWEKKFRLLADFREVHRHCNVPEDYKVKGVNLRTWVYKQRKRYKEGKMDPERERRLRELNLKWDPLEEKWEERYRLLADYKGVHGHCNVPEDYKVKGVNLGTWVKEQRKQYREGNLDREKGWQLRDLGFSFAVMKTWQ